MLAVLVPNWKRRLFIAGRYGMGSLQIGNAARFCWPLLKSLLKNADEFHCKEPKAAGIYTSLGFAKSRFIAQRTRDGAEILAPLARLPTATFTSGPSLPNLLDSRAWPSPRVPLCRVPLSLDRTLSSLRIWTRVEAPAAGNSAPVLCCPRSHRVLHLETPPTRR